MLSFIHAFPDCCTWYIHHRYSKHSSACTPAAPRSFLDLRPTSPLSLKTIALDSQSALPIINVDKPPQIPKPHSSPPPHDLIPTVLQTPLMCHHWILHHLWNHKFTPPASVDHLSAFRLSHFHPRIICSLTPLNPWAILKVTLQRVWRKGNPLILLVGMQTSTATMENSVEIS